MGGGLMKRESPKDSQPNRLGELPARIKCQIIEDKPA